MIRVASCIALLMTLVLAGCTSSPPASNGASDPDAFNDVQVTDTTGAIRGVVFDESITPLEGVQIVIAGGQSKTSDAQGAFVFNGLQPGDYFLTASKLGFKSIQQSATVVAGERSPPITKIQLGIDPTATKPYYQEYVFDGFIQCSGTFVVVGFAACSAANIFTEVTQDNFGVNYAMTEKPQWIQSEMLWDSTQAAGGQMAVMYSWGSCSGFLCDHEAEGASPLLLVATPEDIEVINDGDYNGTDLFVRVFNRGLDETEGSVGLTLNQQFTIYTHMFYGYQPPEGWRFTELGGVPQPPK